MSKFIFVCSFLLFVSFDSSITAQKGAEWMLEQDIHILETMNLEYRHPKGFEKKVLDHFEICCFDFKSEECIAHSCLYFQMCIQADRHFVIFLDMDRIYTVEDSIDWSRMFPDGDFDFIDKAHIMNIRGHLECTKGKEAAESWKNYVTYYPEGEAKRIFNADTVMTYTASLEKGSYFLNKYRHYKIYYLQRKGRGYLPIYCFFDDKAFKKQDKYTKVVDGLFWYGDEEPDWEMIKKKEDEGPIIVIPYGTLKSGEGVSD